MLKTEGIIHASSTGSYRAVQVFGLFDVCSFGVCCLHVVEISLYVDSEKVSKVVCKKEQLKKKLNTTPKYSFVTSIICFKSVDLLGEKTRILTILLFCLLVKKI